MEVTVELTQGPVKFELRGEDPEEVQRELLDLVEFVQDNQELLSGLPMSAPRRGSEADGTQQAPIAQDRPSTTPAAETGEALSSIARRARVDESILHRIFVVPEEESEVPYLVLDDFEGQEEVLGSSRMDRQANGSLLLLHIWQEVLGDDSISSEMLNDALQTSRINPTNRYNMYQAFDGQADAYFRRDGQTVSLTQAGERAAVDEVRRLVELMQSE